MLYTSNKTQARKKAYKREIGAFTIQQEMPVKQETIEKMAPSVGEAAGTVAKGIKKGLKDEE